MDLKKLFNNNKAVSPVIGVVLMVAITVILAAAIGSSVFGQGPAKSAPQANIDIKSAGFAANGSNSIGTLKFEHLGGDAIDFNNSAVTKVVVDINGTSSYQLDATDLGTLDVGSIDTIPMYDTNNAAINVYSGTVAEVKIIDASTSQLICDKTVRF
jgi:flagellin-like protein